MKRLLILSALGLWSLIGAADQSWSEQPIVHAATTVVQMSYYAKPGQEQEVLNIRLSACDVLEKNGVPRGRVLMRGDSPRTTKNADDADVIWEGEFPDAPSLKRYEEVAVNNPDFIAARQKMNAATRMTERRYYQIYQPQ